MYFSLIHVFVPAASRAANLSWTFLYSKKQNENPETTRYKLQWKQAAH